MTLHWRWKLLDLGRRATGIEVADMTPRDIHVARKPQRFPRPAYGASLVEALEHGLMGAPRPDVEIRDDTVEGAAGELGARVHTPRGLPSGRPVIVHYHGGGWTISHPAHYDWYCTNLAHGVGATVVSVDYRKAPDHPAPAAADDAIASYRWISDNRDRYDAGEPIAVAGDSAGGNLAALVAIAARDAGSRLDAQVLVYPGVDLTMSFPSVHRLTDQPILPRASMDAFLDHYLDGSDVQADDPRVSPWFVADASGLAPALVQTAEYDPLVDEGDAYADKLADAGVPVRHTRYVDVPHGFVSLPGLTSAARQAVSEAIGFLNTQLSRG